jgi:hypothetical protein
MEQLALLAPGLVGLTVMLGALYSAYKIMARPPRSAAVSNQSDAGVQEPLPFDEPAPEERRTRGKILVDAILGERIH